MSMNNFISSCQQLYSHVRLAKRILVRTAAAKLENGFVCVPCHAAGNLHQPQAQFMRPVGPPLLAEAEASEQVEDVVRQRGNPQAVGIRQHAAAAHVCERELVLGFLEEVLHGSALAVRGNDFLHGCREVRDKEHQGIREKALLLALVEFDLADDAALARPGIRLILEITIADEIHLFALCGFCCYFVADVLHGFHQARILLQADDVSVPVGFLKVIELRIRESAVPTDKHVRAGEIAVIRIQHRLQERVCILAAVVVPFAELDADKVSRQPVEDGDGMQADGAIMADVLAAFLLPVSREQRRIHIQDDVFWMLEPIRTAQELLVQPLQLAE